MVYSPKLFKWSVPPLCDVDLIRYDSSAGALLDSILVILLRKAPFQLPAPIRIHHLDFRSCFLLLPAVFTDGLNRVEAYRPFGSTGDS